MARRLNLLDDLGNKKNLGKIFWNYLRTYTIFLPGYLARENQISELK